MEVRFCPKCGESRWPDAIFCGKCGFSFDSFEAETKASEAHATGSAPPVGQLQVLAAEALAYPGDDELTRVDALPLPTADPVLIDRLLAPEADEPAAVPQAPQVASVITPRPEPIARQPIAAVPIPPAIQPAIPRRATVPAGADGLLDTQVSVAPPAVVTPTTRPITAQSVPVQLQPQVPPTASGYLPASVPAALDAHRTRRRVGVGFVLAGLALIAVGLGMALFGVPDAATGLTPITAGSEGRQLVDYLALIAVAVLGVVAVGAIAAWATDAIDTAPSLLIVAAAGLGVVALAIASAARVGYDASGAVLPAVSLLVAGGASISSAALVAGLIHE